MREHKYMAYHKSVDYVGKVIAIDWEDGLVSVENSLGVKRVFEINDITLAQYTGLKDKNSVEIYDGYIVEAWSEGCRHIGVVQRRIDGLYIIYPAYKNQKMWGLCPNPNGDTTVEVIGNIYQDKHLLEG